MPRGQPDYGLYTDTPVASGISDPGEAAARLGSINVYDRRGWTVWFDDFESPSLKWVGARTAPGAFPVLSTGQAFSGIQSVHLNAPAGVASASSIARRFPLIRRGKVGFEIWVQGTTVTPGYLELRADIHDGVTPYWAAWRYYSAGRDLYIVTPDGEELIDNLAYMISSRFYFLPVKLVVDMDTDLYTRLVVGEREHDISAYGQNVMAPGTNKFIEVTISIAPNAVFDQKMYLDNFILTQNEP